MGQMITYCMSDLLSKIVAAVKENGGDVNDLKIVEGVQVVDGWVTMTEGWYDHYWNKVHILWCEDKIIVEMKDPAKDTVWSLLFELSIPGTLEEIVRVISTRSIAFEKDEPRKLYSVKGYGH